MSSSFKHVEGKFKIKTAQQFDADIKRKLPIRLAAQAEKHFRSGFEKGGGQTDDSRGGWTARKKSEKGGRRGILIKSGTLRRDVKQRKAGFNNIEVGTSARTVAYAQVHNDGLRSGRGKGFTMPQREFIGHSSVLEARNMQVIKGHLKRMLI